MIPQKNLNFSVIDENTMSEHLVQLKANKDLSSSYHTTTNNKIPIWSHNIQDVCSVNDSFEGQKLTGK